MPTSVFREGCILLHPVTPHIPFEQLVIWEGKDTINAADQGPEDEFAYPEVATSLKMNRDDAAKQVDRG